MMTLASVIDPLRAANRLSTDTRFEWTIVSPDGKDINLSGGFPFKVSAPLSFSASGNFLIVVASFDHQHHGSAQTIRWLQNVARNFDILCGIEAGSWLLARAGLLKERRATTHWEDLEELQQAHLDVEVVDERFVRDEKVWTCGGASPALDMMLHLVEQEASTNLALEVASVFVYDQHHAPSDPQPLQSLGNLQQREPRVSAAIRLMEKNIEQPLPTSQIARRVGVSTKTLEYLFKTSLRETPAAYWLNMRLQVARKMVMDTKLSMQAIAVRCGFNSQSSFSRSFRHRFGVSPMALRTDQKLKF